MTLFNLPNPSRMHRPPLLILGARHDHLIPPDQVHMTAATYGSEAEIAKFCELNYHVTFPMFAKVDVNGDAASPLYRHLKAEKPGVLGSEAIKWNFTKFLVDRGGRVLRRYAPNDTPESMTADIEKAL